MKHVTQKRA